MSQQRINELAIQAGGIWRSGHVEQPNGDSVWTEQKSVDLVDMDLNKFAELIVRECADICYNRDYTNGSAYGEAIEEHFGVEE